MVHTRNVSEWCNLGRLQSVILLYYSKRHRILDTPFFWLSSWLCHLLDSLFQ